MRSNGRERLRFCFSMNSVRSCWNEKITFRQPEQRVSVELYFAVFQCMSRFCVQCVQCTALDSIFSFILTINEYQCMHIYSLVCVCFQVCYIQLNSMLHYFCVFRGAVNGTLSWLRQMHLRLPLVWCRRACRTRCLICCR